MVVMLTLGNFKHRVATLKVVAHHQASRFKLSQHPVYSCQANILTRIEQGLVDIFGTHMARRLSGIFE